MRGFREVEEVSSRWRLRTAVPATREEKLTAAPAQESLVTRLDILPPHPSGESVPYTSVSISMDRQYCQDTTRHTDKDTMHAIKSKWKC